LQAAAALVTSLLDVKAEIRQGTIVVELAGVIADGEENGLPS
jgi:hypothetical protein